MLYNQELIQKKEKAEKIIKELMLYSQDDYLPVVIEALQDYIEAIETELQKESI